MTSMERRIKRTSSLGKSLSKISTGCCNFRGSDENGCVAHRNTIQIELIKLATGARLLRLTEPTSGLALGRTLDPKVPVSAQKEALAKVFQAALKQGTASILLNNAKDCESRGKPNPLDSESPLQFKRECR